MILCFLSHEVHNGTTTVVLLMQSYLFCITFGRIMSLYNQINLMLLTWTMYVHLGQLAKSFEQTTQPNPTYTLEEVCDFIRHHFQRLNPTLFAWGAFTSVQNIFDYMLASSQPVTTSSMYCPNGHDVQQAEMSAFSCQLTILTPFPTLQNFVDNLSVQSSSHCHSCNQHLIRTHMFLNFPTMLAFDLSGHTTLLTKSLNYHREMGNILHMSSEV